LFSVIYVLAVAASDQQSIGRGADPCELGALPTQTSSSENGEHDFYDEIAPRRRAIEADLKTGVHERWEAVYYDGSPHLGFARGWALSRKLGYVSTTRRCDMGKVEVAGDRIALVSEAPGKAWGLMPLEYVIVPWDQQVYLVEPSELIEFCNDVNSGRLRAHGPAGRYPLRVGDFGKKPIGLPRVPRKYDDYLLRQPITAKVLQTNGNKGDVAVLGQHRLWSGFSLTLNVGKKDGVRTGMRFYLDPQPADDFPDAYVISVNATRSELLECSWQEDAKPQAKIGMRLTTLEPAPRH
jgi:hypothetical protein